jgi:hypothetical protein
VIWSDIAAEDETDYLHWLTREHTTERISTGGFLGVRVFRELTDERRRYLIVYRLESPVALASPEYLKKLDNPTPWTQRSMPRLKNFVRGGGRVVAEAGIGAGGFVAARLFHDRLPEDIATIVQNLARQDRIAAVRFVETDAHRTTLKTREKSMRQGDKSFGGVLLVEALDEPSARRALGDETAPLYTQVFEQE